MYRRIFFLSKEQNVSAVKKNRRFDVSQNERFGLLKSKTHSPHLVVGSSIRKLMTSCQSKSLPSRQSRDRLDLIILRFSALYFSRTIAGAHKSRVEGTHKTGSCQ